jgi:hypothetical protein
MIDMAIRYPPSFVGITNDYVFGGMNEFVKNTWDYFNNYKLTDRQRRLISEALAERPLPSNMQADPCGEIHIAKMEYTNPYKYATITINGKEFTVKKDTWYPIESIVYLVFGSKCWDGNFNYRLESCDVGGCKVIPHNWYTNNVEFKFSDGDALLVSESSI